LRWPSDFALAAKVGSPPFMTFRLDFVGTGSVCVTMDENVRDSISRGFAELTILMEDAATLAVVGQSQKQAVRDAKEIIKAIWPLLISCDVAMASIEHAIDDVGIS
jgi:hypothetical protein